MSWTSIPASVYAVGKPITSVSYGYLKDNGDYLKALFDAATGHKHTGAADDAPQIPQGGIAASAIGLSELKTATGSWSGTVSTGATVYVSTHKWGHTPYVGSSNDGLVNWSYEDAFEDDSGINSDGEVIRVQGYSSSARTGHIKWNYHIT